MESLLSDSLIQLFNGVAAYKVGRVPLSELRRFRVLEPQLVSVLDGKDEVPEEHWALGVEAYGKLVGVASAVVSRNEMRPDARKAYGRIDIVIVPEYVRGLGISRVLLAAIVIELLDTRGSDLYSISCLAGHSAIAHTLELFGFAHREKRDADFVHEQISLESADACLRLKGLLLGDLEEHVSVLNYRLRQRKDELGAA